MAKEYIARLLKMQPGFEVPAKLAQAGVIGLPNADAGESLPDDPDAPLVALIDEPTPQLAPALPDIPDTLKNSITPILGDTEDQTDADKRASELFNGSNFKPQPDMATALQFARLLTGEANPIVRLRFVHDRDRDAPSIERAGSIETLWPDVEFAPSANVGTFFLPNCFGFEGDGFARDSDATTFYCHFADFDRGIPTAWHRQPDLVVYSSVKDGGQRGAAYWLIAPMSADRADEWKRNQARLLAHYGDDTTVKNPSRLMRLPGSLHMKREARLVSFESFIDPDARLLGLPTSADVAQGLPDLAAPADRVGSDVHELDLPGALQIKSSHLYGRVKPVRDGLQVDTGNGIRVAHVGDWIVFDKAKDRLQVVTDATFQDEYEPDERKAPTRGRRYLGRPKLPADASLAATCFNGIIAILFPALRGL